MKKAMLLHFKCEAPTATRFCVLPDRATFTTETMEWSRWLKMGLSAAKLGKSILSADALACHGKLIFVRNAVGPVGWTLGCWLVVYVARGP